jgi:ribonuclease VapC
MSSSRKSGLKQSVSSTVIDSSALLAVLRGEAGASAVTEVLDEGAVVSAVNLSEVVAKMQDLGFSEEQTREDIRSLKVELISDFSETDAWLAGLLRAVTRSKGLSFGDRACLALASSLGLPVLTADRHWADVDVGVEVKLCR